MNSNILHFLVRREGGGGCLQISKYCTVENSIYGYKPSIGWNSFFLAVFLVSSLIHAFQGWKYKTWSFLVAMVIGGLSEAVGQGGRIMLHKNVYDDAGFKLQIVLLTLAPAFLCAGIYLTLKHLVISFGASFSRLPPKWYTWIFISCDIFSIVLQGAGGGLASAADDNDTTLLNAGNNLMIAGLAWQVFTLVLFGALSAEYVYQIRRHVHELNPQTHDMRQSKRFKFFVGAVALAYIAILMRCVYRVAEMAGGWGNEIMQDEAMMLGLDSFMIAIAMVALNLFHPGLCFDFRRYGSNKGNSSGNVSDDMALETKHENRVV